MKLIACLIAIAFALVALAFRWLGNPEPDPFVEPWGDL